MGARQSGQVTWETTTGRGAGGDVRAVRHMACYTGAGNSQAQLCKVWVWVARTYQPGFISYNKCATAVRVKKGQRRVG